MGLCEELGIERDDYSEDISDNEWARRWETAYQAREAAMSPLQKFIRRHGRFGAELLVDLASAVERECPGQGRRLLQAMAIPKRDH